MTTMVKKEIDRLESLTKNYLFYINEIEQAEAEFLLEEFVQRLSTYIFQLKELTKNLIADSMEDETEFKLKLSERKRLETEINKMTGCLIDFHNDMRRKSIIINFSGLFIERNNLFELVLYSDDADIFVKISTLLAIALRHSFLKLESIPVIGHFLIRGALERHVEASLFSLRHCIAENDNSFSIKIVHKYNNKPDSVEDDFESVTMFHLNNLKNYKDEEPVLRIIQKEWLENEKKEKCAKKNLLSFDEFEECTAFYFLLFKLKFKKDFLWKWILGCNIILSSKDLFFVIFPHLNTEFFNDLKGKRLQNLHGYNVDQLTLLFNSAKFLLNGEKKERICLLSNFSRLFFRMKDRKLVTPSDQLAFLRMLNEIFVFEDDLDLTQLNNLTQCLKNPLVTFVGEFCALFKEAKLSDSTPISILTNILNLNEKMNIITQPIFDLLLEIYKSILKWDDEKQYEAVGFSNLLSFCLSFGDLLKRRAESQFEMEVFLQNNDDLKAIISDIFNIKKTETEIEVNSSCTLIIEPQKIAADRSPKTKIFFALNIYHLDPSYVQNNVPHETLTKYLKEAVQHNLFTVHGKIFFPVLGATLFEKFLPSLSPKKEYKPDLRPGEKLFDFNMVDANFYKQLFLATDQIGENSFYPLFEFLQTYFKEEVLTAHRRYKRSLKEIYGSDYSNFIEERANHLQDFANSTEEDILIDKLVFPEKPCCEFLAAISNFQSDLARKKEHLKYFQKLERKISCLEKIAFDESRKNDFSVTYTNLFSNISAAGVKIKHALDDEMGFLVKHLIFRKCPIREAELIPNLRPNLVTLLERLNELERELTCFLSWIVKFKENDNVDINMLMKEILNYDDAKHFIGTVFDYLQSATKQLMRFIVKSLAKKSITFAGASVEFEFLKNPRSILKVFPLLEAGVDFVKFIINQAGYKDFQLFLIKNLSSLHFSSSSEKEVDFSTLVCVLIQLWDSISLDSEEKIIEMLTLQASISENLAAFIIKKNIDENTVNIEYIQTNIKIHQSKDLTAFLFPPFLENIYIQCLYNHPLKALLGSNERSPVLAEELTKKFVFRFLETMWTVNCQYVSKQKENEIAKVQKKFNIFKILHDFIGDSTKQAHLILLHEFFILKLRDKTNYFLDYELFEKVLKEIMLRANKEEREEYRVFYTNLLDVSIRDITKAERGVMKEILNKHNLPYSISDSLILLLTQFIDCAAGENTSFSQAFTLKVLIILVQDLLVSEKTDNILAPFDSWSIVYKLVLALARIMKGLKEILNKDIFYIDKLLTTTFDLFINYFKLKRHKINIAQLKHVSVEVLDSFIDLHILDSPFNRVMKGGYLKNLFTMFYYILEQDPDKIFMKKVFNLIKRFTEIRYKSVCLPNCSVNSNSHFPTYFGEFSAELTRLVEVLFEKANIEFLEANFEIKLKTKIYDCNNLGSACLINEDNTKIELSPRSIGLWKEFEVLQEVYSDVFVSGVKRLCVITNQDDSFTIRLKDPKGIALIESASATEITTFQKDLLDLLINQLIDQYAYHINLYGYTHGRTANSDDYMQTVMNTDYCLKIISVLIRKYPLIINVLEDYKLSVEHLCKIFTDATFQSFYIKQNQSNTTEILFLDFLLDMEKTFSFHKISNIFKAMFEANPKIYFNEQGVLSKASDDYRERFLKKLHRKMLVSLERDDFWAFEEGPLLVMDYVTKTLEFYFVDPIKSRLTKELTHEALSIFAMIHEKIPKGIAMTNLLDSCRFYFTLKLLFEKCYSVGRYEESLPYMKYYSDKHFKSMIFKVTQGDATPAAADQVGIKEEKRRFVASDSMILSVVRKTEEEGLEIVERKKAIIPKKQFKNNKYFEFLNSSFTGNSQSLRVGSIYEFVKECLFSNSQMKSIYQDPKYYYNLDLTLKYFEAKMSQLEPAFKKKEDLEYDKYLLDALYELSKKELMGKTLAHCETGKNESEPYSLNLEGFEILIEEKQEKPEDIKEKTNEKSEAINEIAVGISAKEEFKSKEKIKGNWLDILNSEGQYDGKHKAILEHEERRLLAEFLEEELPENIPSDALANYILNLSDDKREKLFIILSRKSIESLQNAKIENMYSKTFGAIEGDKNSVEEKDLDEKLLNFSNLYREIKKNPEMKKAFNNDSFFLNLFEIEDSALEKIVFKILRDPFKCPANYYFNVNLLKPFESNDEKISDLLKVLSFHPKIACKVVDLILFYILGCVDRIDTNPMKKEEKLFSILNLNEPTGRICGYLRNIFRMINNLLSENFFIKLFIEGLYDPYEGISLFEQKYGKEDDKSIILPATKSLEEARKKYLDFEMIIYPMPIQQLFQTLISKVGRVDYLISSLLEIIGTINHLLIPVTSEVERKLIKFPEYPVELEFLPEFYKTFKNRKILSHIFMTFIDRSNFLATYKLCPIDFNYFSDKLKFVAELTLSKPYELLKKGTEYFPSPRELAEYQNSLNALFQFITDFSDELHNLIDFMWEKKYSLKLRLKLSLVPSSEMTQSEKLKQLKDNKYHFSSLIKNMLGKLLLQKTNLLKFYKKIFKIPKEILAKNNFWGKFHEKAVETFCNLIRILSPNSGPDSRKGRLSLENLEHISLMIKETEKYTEEVQTETKAAMENKQENDQENKKENKGEYGDLEGIKTEDKDEKQVKKHKAMQSCFSGKVFESYIEANGEEGDKVKLDPLLFLVKEFPSMLSDLTQKKLEHIKGISKSKIKNKEPFRATIIKFQIDRSKLWQSTVKNMISVGAPQLICGAFKITFENENGIDAGGLTREWLTLCSQEILNPSHGLFKLTPNNDFVVPNNGSQIVPNVLMHYRVLGRLIGKALIEGLPFYVDFPKFIYKTLLGKEIVFEDLEDYDKALYKNLKWLRENDHTSVLLSESNFLFESTHFDSLKVTEMIPNGRNVNLNQENKNDFIQSLCNILLVESIKEQTRAILEGIEDIIPRQAFQLLTEEDLQKRLTGISEIDVSQLRENSDYNNFPNGQHENLVVWFWQILESFDQKDLSDLLFYVTGSYKIPFNGYKEFKIKLNKVNLNEMSLPVAHTCFKQLDIPNYKSLEIMRDKIYKAIKEWSATFGIS